MKTLVLAAFATLGLTAIAAAQDSSPLPAQCTNASKEAASGMAGMEDMDVPMMQQMQKMHGVSASAMGQMKSMHQTMKPMMQAMMIKDQDLAFACAMIPHHQGAIDMAKAELANGKNETLKQFAQKVIDAQTREIEELKAEIAKIAK